MNKVVLIGTSHKYQTCRDDVGAEFTAQFRQLLFTLCSKYGVKAIAEELNRAALEERGVSESVAQMVSAELGLVHQYADPSPELRKQLGVCAETDIRSDGFLRNWSDERIESEVRKSHAIRERYWLDQLRELNSWPLLFVCGANHVEPFFALLREHGFEVTVSFADWEPNSSQQADVSSVHCARR